MLDTSAGLCELSAQFELADPFDSLELLAD
jgi:hypothetical protein